MDRKNQDKTNTPDNEGNKVVDFTQVREKRLEEKRRNNTRVLFKNLINVFSVTGKSLTHPVEIIEASEEGLSFHVPFTPNRPWPTTTTELPLRIYFSQDTFLEILVHIKNSKPSIENGQRFIRFGCSVDTETKSYPAYQSFAKFLKLYAEHSHRDLGDVSAFYR